MKQGAALTAAVTSAGRVWQPSKLWRLRPTEEFPSSAAFSLGSPWCRTPSTRHPLRTPQQQEQWSANQCSCQHRLELIRRANLFSQTTQKAPLRVPVHLRTTLLILIAAAMLSTKLRLLLLCRYNGKRTLDTTHEQGCFSFFFFFFFATHHLFSYCILLCVV